MSIDLAPLPYRELPAASILYRIHRSEHDPWQLAATGDNRFDPVGAESVGAACWAEDPLAAWVEVFRTRMHLTEQEIAARVLSDVPLKAPLLICDLTKRKALRAGVTAAPTAGHDYSEARELASQLTARCGGIRWRVRHDLAGELIGVAIFGPLGHGRARERSTDADWRGSGRGDRGLPIRAPQLVEQRRPSLQLMGPAEVAVPRSLRSCRDDPVPRTYEPRAMLIEQIVSYP